jgi:hypothetical protein
MRRMPFFGCFFALALLIAADLRAKKTAHDRAERERSCKPEAKANHCRGA